MTKKDTPKKTGKRMTPPEDPKDVNVVPGSKASDDLSLQAAPVAASATQGTLVDDGEVDTPVTAEVKDGNVLMTFVKTTLIKARGSEERFVALHLSAMIAPESAALFSDRISKRFEVMDDDDGITELTVDDIPSQMLDIYRPEDMERVLHELVTPQRVRLEWKETKGSGEAVDGIRLSFVTPIKLRDEVLNWAARTFGTLVWVKMNDSQGRLKAVKGNRVA